MEDSVHRNNDIRLQSVHLTLDRMHISPGPLENRLAYLINHDQQLRHSISDALATRLQAIEQLTTLTRQLSLPPQSGICARMLKDQATRVQVELERIVADLALMDLDYSHIESFIASYKAKRAYGGQV